MLNALARWYVSRSLDCDRPLPSWVERRLVVDANLRDFQRRSTLLMQRLRSADKKAAGSTMAERFEAPPVALQGRRALVALALAALILVVLWPLFGLRNEHEVPVVSEIATNQTLVDASEELELNGLTEAGTELLSNFNDRAAEFTEPIADPLRDAGSWLAVLESDSDKIAERLAKGVIAPTSELGSRYGQLLSEVDGEIATSNRRMISNSVSTWRSLLHGAPKRIAAFGWSIP